MSSRSIDERRRRKAATAASLVLATAAYSATSSVPFADARIAPERKSDHPPKIEYDDRGGDESSDGGTDNLDPPLTDEENALLAELTLGSGGDGLLALPPSLAECHSKLSTRLESSKESLNKFGELRWQRGLALEERRNELSDRTAKLEREVRARNAEELQKLWGRLNATMGEELRRRDAMDESRRSVEEEVKRAKEAFGAATLAQEDEKAPRKKGKGDKENEAAPAVTLDELAEALDRDAILSPTESDLEAWAAELAAAEFRSHAQSEKTKLDDRRKSREERSKCVDPATAGSLVHSDLRKHSADGVGRIDYASLENGGSIVYAEGMTSEPYDPRDDLGKVRIGETWWRRYVPEDWEQVFPYGWERWMVPAEGWRGFIPSYVWTSLGLKSAPIQPPESALTPNTNVGSCYPLPGQSGGKLTVRLVRPIRVDAVTIDHVPAVLGGERGESSAVRHFKVTAYAPCKKRGLDEKEREECERTGFDASHSFDMGEYEYKIVTSKMDRDGNAPGGRSIQTFDVTEALEEAAELDDEEEEETEEEEEEEDEDEVRERKASVSPMADISV
mmetsp:Transcript_57531/g.171575  ORF Transcript_57531/g.171575 Transcript_57531/m.171575 type:complete len:564 (-) Transcript_57531:418-2109(-)